LIVKTSTPKSTTKSLRYLSSYCSTTAIVSAVIERLVAYRIAATKSRKLSNHRFDVENSSPPFQGLTNVMTRLMVHIVRHCGELPLLFASKVLRRPSDPVQQRRLLYVFHDFCEHGGVQDNLAVTG
jgi:hypothetical protein